MTRPSALLLVAAGAAFALSPALGATGTAASTPRVKTVKGEVQSLGMDGPIIAYGVKFLADCGGRVFFWNVETNGGGVVSGKETCESNTSSTGAGIDEVAVAATARRFAWIVNEGGNTESDDYLYASSLPNSKERYLGMAMRMGDVDSGDLDGDSISGLVGDGSVLAVSRYTTDNRRRVAGSLRLIGRTKALPAIARGVESVISASASGGRIALLVSSDKVKVLSSSGRLVRAFRTEAARDAALTGTQLVVLTETSLQVFDVGGASLLHAWPAKRNGFRLDADSGFATYTILCLAAPCSRSIWVTRLSDGKTVLLGRARDFVAGLELEPAGLVYATQGRLVRYSLKQLQAALG